MTLDKPQPPPDPAPDVLKLADGLSIGKRLPDAVYVHVDGLRECPVALQKVVARALDQAAVQPDAFNVVKFGTLAPRLSLLCYERFDEDPFPSLTRAWTIDLRSLKVTERRYDPSGNPPILHRKEALLGVTDLRMARWADLTRALDEAGLYSDATKIGRRRAWSERLRERGYAVEDHALVRLESAPKPATTDVGVVERHRTAIERNVLSTPVQHLWRHGFIDAQRTFFDYGCGRGGDLRALRAAGIDARGWDPYYAPAETKAPAAVVNLGFVLNVIENPAERDEALRGAYALTEKVLAVAAMLGGAGTTDRFQRFGDGVLTQRNTFQKYFSQEELRSYIERTLGREPVAVGPGVFFLFREDEDEQAFLEASQRAFALPPTVPAEPRLRERPRRQSSTSSTKRRLEPDAALLDAFWECALSLGRVPARGEFLHEAELRCFGRPTRILDALLRERGAEVLERAAVRRREDLLVFLAMNQFEKRRSRGRWTERMRHDVQTFLGAPKVAEAQATTLLYSIGSPDALRAAAKEAAANRLGHLDAEHSLQLECRMVRELPSILRIYAGCAARLYGNLDSADLVKLHLGSGKVTLLFYDDFYEKPFPMLEERIKINLRAQIIEFFQYGAAFPSQPLYRKSKYLSLNAPHFSEQCALDATLEAARLFDSDGFGPPWVDFQERLRRACIEVSGFQLRSTQGRLGEILKPES
ncbi:MAG: DNA phosphorothioation-associated putative methyltransferase [Nannocystaceae bacterium]